MAVNGKAYAPAQEFKYLYAKFHRNRCSTSYIVQAVKADYQSYFRIYHISRYYFNYLSFKNLLLGLNVAN